MHITSRLTTIVFDVDGTLYRQPPLRRAMLLRLLAAHAADPVKGWRTLWALQAYRRAQEHLRGHNSDMAAAQTKLACERARVEAPFLRACVQRWMEQAPLPLLSRYIQPGLIEFLEACRARRLRLGALSDYPADAKLRALGIADYFDVVLCAQSAEIGVFKPDPRGLQVTLARLNAKANESLYVGDRAEVDATAAAEVGITCAIITRPPGQHAYVSHIQVDGYPSLKRLVFGNENATRSAVGFNEVAYLSTNFTTTNTNSTTSNASTGFSPIVPMRRTLWAHIQIARIDHWFKNVFVLPGLIAAIGIDGAHATEGLWTRIAVGLVSICFVASSNYIINEVLDARSDRSHPVKGHRPTPMGRVSIPLAYVQWVALMVIGVGLGLLVSRPFALTVFVLWVMGCIYNISPVRSKDVPYVDVLSEAVNNPLRMLAGWFIGSSGTVAPASLLLSYWMIGCYFMAIKRYAEYNEIGNRKAAVAYRKSFAYYTSERLMVSIMFYGSAAMLFLGAFIMRYRLELILAFPLVAWVMAMYLELSFKPNSAVQRPECLYREPQLMAAVLVCAAAMSALMLINIPVLQDIFTPTAPTRTERRAR